jgi:hypothetical protein
MDVGFEPRGIRGSGSWTEKIRIRDNNRYPGSATLIRSFDKLEIFDSRNNVTDPSKVYTLLLETKKRVN